MSVGLLCHSSQSHSAAGGTNADPTLSLVFRLRPVTDGLSLPLSVTLVAAHQHHAGIFILLGLMAVQVGMYVCMGCRGGKGVTLVQELNR